MTTHEIQYFATAASLDFANQTLEFAPSTLKFNAHIRNWPFASIAHSLAIVFRAATPSGAIAPCNVQQGLGENDSLQWLLITINGTAMYPCPPPLSM
jgi:hypothetical protein